MQIGLVRVLAQRRSRPVHFKQRTPDVRHRQPVLGKDLLRFGNLRVGDDLQVLPPHLAQFNEAQVPLLCNDKARMIEILRDLIRDHADLERRARGEGARHQGESRRSAGRSL